MMRAKTAIRSLAESGRAPSEILFRANNTLCDGNDAEMFVTVWIGIIDLGTGDMRCANAGHEYPVLLRAGGEYELFKDKHGVALGAMENMRFSEYELKLNPGDRLFVYTDGIPEAIDLDEQQYGTDRLTAKLNTLRDATMAQTLPAVREDVARFAGKAEQFDDITMLGFAYYGEEGRQAP
jgi:serine phosphatase RsbU (regulator of sigma subunit)